MNYKRKDDKAQSTGHDADHASPEELDGGNSHQQSHDEDLAETVEEWEEEEVFHLGRS